MKIFQVMVILLMSPGAMAEDGRRYSVGNEFIGTYREDNKGTFRLYDKYGAFEGTVVPDDKDGYRSYDEDNTFDGTIDEDE